MHKILKGKSQEFFLHLPIPPKKQLSSQTEQPSALSVAIALRHAQFLGILL